MNLIKNWAFAFSLAALILGSSAAMPKEKEKINIKTPRVLEFDYKKGETDNYSMTIEFKSESKTPIRGYLEGNYKLKSRFEAKEENNGISELEIKLQRAEASIETNVEGYKTISIFKWEDKNRNPEFINEKSFHWTIKKTGEVYMSDNFGSEEIDYFPGYPVKFGDTWKSSINGSLREIYSGESIKYESDNVAMRFSGKTNYKGINAFVIDFSGNAKIKTGKMKKTIMLLGLKDFKNPDNISGITEGIALLKGKLIYDPEKKKILEIDLNNNFKGYALNEKNKADFEITEKSEFKRD